jgi:hypothetical protein
MRTRLGLLVLGVAACSGTIVTETSSSGVGGAIPQTTRSQASTAGHGGATASSSRLGPSSVSSASSSGAGTGGSCTPSETLCSGSCTDLSTDPMNCGGCGLACAQSEVCGALGCTCELGFANCNGILADGCETSVGTDPTNCGDCGNVCQLPHATANCMDETCVIAMCDVGGWVDCDGNPANGCEVNLQDDPENCGQCGVACPIAEPCTAGACFECAPGTATCPGDPPDSCLTMLGTDKNCHFCGDTCALANAEAGCMPMGYGFACSVVLCNLGFADCDMMSPNGCEVDTMTDPNNCGACGSACAAGHTCAGGICQ